MLGWSWRRLTVISQVNQHDEFSNDKHLNSKVSMNGDGLQEKYAPSAAIHVRLSRFWIVTATAPTVEMSQFLDS